MPDLNRVPGFRSALEILADVVVKTEFAILDQQHDARGNELLAYGADLVNRFGCGRNVELDVGEAVTL